MMLGVKLPLRVYTSIGLKLALALCCRVLHLKNLT